VAATLSSACADAAACADAVASGTVPVRRTLVAASEVGRRPRAAMGAVAPGLLDGTFDLDGSVCPLNAAVKSGRGGGGDSRRLSVLSAGGLSKSNARRGLLPTGAAV
jgi:hypothetical protein